MKLLLLVAVASLAVVSCASSLSMEDQEFHAWKLKFGKVYRSPKVEALRKDIWLSTRRTVLAHNILADQGIKTYRMGMNDFSDMDEHEYMTLYGRLLPKDSFNGTTDCDVHPLSSTAPLPKYMNWRDKGCVTPVKNQSSCGSCWAFSAVGAVESHTCIKNKQRHPTPLSEQQLVDCAKSEGCKDGNNPVAYQYCKDNDIVTEDFYPYKAKNLTCQLPPTKPPPEDQIGARCSGCRRVPGDEESLQRAVAEEGPVAITVPVHLSLRQYVSGVYYEPNCKDPPTGGYHSMLVVGYGTADKGGDYWLVKNSYGASWGEDGYIRMARNKNNNCDIATYAYYPVVLSMRK